MNDLLHDLVEWQKQGHRAVDINIRDNGEIKIWVFDYELRTGQFVNSVDEIDLEKKKMDEEIQEYERLKKQFEEAI